MSKYFETRTGSLEEAINAMKYEEPGKYAKIFKRELEKAGKGIGAMTPQEKKDFFNKLDKMYHAKNEDLEEAFTSQQIKMAYGVANDPRYKGGNYTGAVKAIEKIAKGLSNHPDVKKVLQRVNEGRMSDIDGMRKKGASADEIAKELKLDPKVVKQILGEGTMIGGLMRYSGQPSSEYAKAKKAYKDFMAKPQPAKTAGDRVMAFVFDDEMLDDIYDASKKNKADVRDMVAKRLKKLGFNEEVELDETHTYMTTKMNKKQKDAEGEEKPVVKESVFDAIKSVWNDAAEELEEVKKNAKYMKAQPDAAADEPADGDSDATEKDAKDDKKKTLVGSKATKVDTKPEVEYK